ncbi:SpoIIE family protein phosphatase [Piscirickettsia salmonis]|uniref:SpoIIE family protein phosphatase n=1 Tax=Piscirickettsia salmonis TaxID=1238 RepID=UPI003EB8DB3E
MNRSFKKSEGDIYSYLYKLSVFLVIVVTFLLLTILSFFFYNHTSNKIRNIENNLNKLYRLSDKIEEKIVSTSFILKEVYTDPRSLTRDFKKSIDFFTNLGLLNKYFYGVGYAVNPVYKEYAVYIYRNPLGKIVADNMVSVYAKHQQKYYERPWFKQVVNDSKPHYFSPQTNLFGTPSYDLTYTFPLSYKKRVYAVGIVDVSMSEFFYLLFKELKSYEDVDVYYISGKYNNHKDEIISLDGDFISSKKLKNLKEYYGSGGLNKKKWFYKGGSLYINLCFMRGSLNFIVKIDLVPIFCKIAFLFIVIIFTVLFITLFLLSLSRRAITNISFPIEHIVKEVNKIAMGDLSNAISITSCVYEVNALSQSIESMRSEIIKLIKKEKESENIKAEIQLASRIQSAFLSQSNKNFGQMSKYLDIFSCYDKGNMISGDIYFINKIGESIYIFIGDSSGKDVAASIFSLFVLARFKILSSQLLSPGRLLTELNDYLCEFNREAMFITAMCCKIDTTNMTCVFANAGHDLPLLYSAESKKVKEILCDPNLILGVLAKQNYIEATVKLCKNEEIILYTDGITEAVKSSKYYGKHNLITFIKNSNRESITDLAKALVADVAEFNYDGKNKDDRTAIWIKVR